jgi:predicted amidohydrolase YtcJ
MRASSRAQACGAASADLAVLSSDPLTVEERKIAELASLMTMVGGRIVHETAGWAG